MRRANQAVSEAFRAVYRRTAHTAIWETMSARALSGSPPRRLPMSVSCMVTACRVWRVQRQHAWPLAMTGNAGR